MSSQWLPMRIAEEQERLRREALVRERLPSALRELYGVLAACLQEYKAAFGDEAAEIRWNGPALRITVREQLQSAWEPRTEIDISTVGAPPGFLIEGIGETFQIEIGMLEGQKLFFRRGDHYLTMENVTRAILDKALFPKLGE
jgi:hypothetical protein